MRHISPADICGLAHGGVLDAAMGPYQRADPAALTVRELKVRKKVLVTSFLQPREAGKRALDKPSGQRWPVEADLRHIKMTLGMEALSCKTPAMCKKELMIEMRAWSPRRFLSDAPQDTAALVTLVAQSRVRNKPRRVELRLVKRRPKPFARLQTNRLNARADISKHGRFRKEAL